ncbi:MAG: ATP-binding protein [Rhodospirillaceae bacterium]|nr:ATP-binding protein [Rhodospirillaceae bacterium]
MADISDGSGVQLNTAAANGPFASVLKAGRADAGSYLAATFAVILAFAAGLVVDAIVHAPSVLLVFLPAVLYSAMRFGFWQGLWASFLSVPIFCYFFGEPRFSFADPRHSLQFFKVTDPANIWALFVFVIAAAVTSTLANRLREKTEVAELQARLTRRLSGFSSRLSGTVTADDLFAQLVLQIRQIFGLEAAVLTPAGAGAELAIKASCPDGMTLKPADWTAATWCLTHGTWVGPGSEVSPGTLALLTPLRSATQVLGVVAVRRSAGRGPLSGDEIQVLETLCTQSAMTLERLNLTAKMQQAQVWSETERLRSALLTSISHDLKTPLASILGTVSSLRRFGERYDLRTRDEMLLTAEEEAERLNRFISNVLDMTRLDAGALRPKIEPADIGDLVGAAIKRTEKQLSGREFVTGIPDELPMVSIDFVLMEHVLVNLIENAIKYTPDGAKILIVAHSAGGSVILDVEDDGRGIPPEDLPRVFDRFYRARNADRQRAGTGLGLAICKGFVEAMGGSIRAANRDGGGARFSISLPASLHVTAT